MSKERLVQLQERAEAAENLDEALLHETAEALKEVFDEAPARPELLPEPTEAVLHLVDRYLPGWNIALHGQAVEPDGHWSCTLRESGDLDNDDVIGTGHGPRVSVAVLRALLQVAILKCPD